MRYGQQAFGPGAQGPGAEQMDKNGAKNASKTGAHGPHV